MYGGVQSGFNNCCNSTHNVMTPDYAPAPRDTNISISAVVSASCFIVNDQEHQTNPSLQIQFNQQDFSDVFDEGIAMQLGNAAPYYHKANEYNPEVNNFDLFTCPDETQQTGQTFGQQPCLENAASLESPVLLNLNQFHDQIPPVSCENIDGSPGSCSQRYMDNESEFARECLESRNIANFNAQTTVTMSSCDSYISDSSQTTPEFGMSCSVSSVVGQEKTPTKTSGDDFKESKAEVNVDEMISNGITVAGFKPRGIIRKRKKNKTPFDTKDGGYWSKRTKNNDSARKSRETKKEMERKFYKRALELEYENFYLKEKIINLENQLLSFNRSMDNMFEKPLV